jgi:hypothetical protein
MRTKLAALVAGVGLMLASGSVIAHHSFSAEFDADRPINFKGVVTKIEWMNPHAYFYLDVTEPDGKVVNWGLEMGSPNGLMRAGWTRNTMTVGDVVTVEGSRAKDGTHTGNVRAVTLASTGRRLFANSSESQTANR